MRPLILLIESSTSRTLAGLCDGDEVCVTARVNASQRHASGLVPAIADGLRERGVAPSAIDAIAVGVGPGSFTGVRVGVTAAKVLAHALRKPLIALDSLSIVAAGIGDDREAVVVADAQRGAWFVARFRSRLPGQVPEILAPTRIEPRDEVVRSLGRGQVLVGPALERGFEESALPMGVIVAPEPQWYPSTSGMACLAAAVLERSEFVDPASLEPFYIRPSAAEEKKAAEA